MINLVTFAQALADETRWRILQLVMDAPLCVCEVAEILDMPQSSVSSHIQVIRKSGLLDSEKCGKWVYYQAAAAHRRLLTTLAATFQASLDFDDVLRRDAERARQRIAVRAESCCPLPERLTRLTEANVNTPLAGSFHES